MDAISSGRFKDVFVFRNVKTRPKLFIRNGLQGDLLSHLVSFRRKLSLQDKLNLLATFPGLRKCLPVAAEKLR